MDIYTWPVNDYRNYLCHYGILGMKWGIRRYQNPDGSLTSEGRERYGISEKVKSITKDVSDRFENDFKPKISAQKRINSINKFARSNGFYFTNVDNANSNPMWSKFIRQRKGDYPYGITVRATVRNMPYQKSQTDEQIKRAFGLAKSYESNFDVHDSINLKAIEKQLNSKEKLHCISVFIADDSGHVMPTYENRNHEVDVDYDMIRKKVVSVDVKY